MPRSSLLWLLALLVLPAVNLVGDQSVPQDTPAETVPAVAAEAPVTEADAVAEAAAPPVITASPDRELSWIPKTETGVLRFLKNNPQADGRDVVVAIFDTGVDPAAAGLQTTPDGRPKILDLVDGTGSGDVQMQDAIKAEAGELTGLTGRKLRLGADWKNPTGEYRLGLKVGYELFPNDLVTLIKATREKEFRATQNEQLAELKRQLAAQKKAHPQPDEQQKKQQEDLQAQAELLEAMLKVYSDPGPLYDCVVFHDGEHYRAVVDTNENGDLTDEKVLTNFRTERQYATIADPVNLNFAVNIYDEGSVLSLVTDTGAHGTHVAGIVAAYYPDQPEWNGVAPGAQIISVKIGDTRLKGMETGPGLVRGLKAVLENHCDLINMSYGEQTSVPDFGRVSELYSQIVTEHDVIFLASAGNAGPALTTVGAPGGTTSALISVGAYISPEMMRSEYSLREQYPGLPYTWTSRGPTADGAAGVDIFAPGGAIAPVPHWTRQTNQLMNGTSMASPNACGNVALLLSAAKQQKLTYTPFSIRKAIQNSAVQVEGAEPFATGPGLLQVDKAWQYLTSHDATYAEHLNYDVRVQTLNNARGVYLRERFQTRQPVTHRITVRPLLKEKAPIEQRLEISLTLDLKSTADWVQSGDLLHLSHGGNRFDILIDPTGLTPGAHYAEIQAFDREQAGAGPLFRLPVTVIIPAEEEQAASFVGFQRSDEFQPGMIQRNFVQVPAGAAWAELKMKLVETPDRKFFRVHTLQLIDGANFEHVETGEYYNLAPEVETVHRFAVVPGRMLEVDLAQFWSILGNSKVEYELHFRGGQPDNTRLGLATGEGTKPVLLHNALATEQFAPKGNLETWRRLLAPQSSATQVLSRDRDQLPDGTSVYEMTVDYSLTLDSKSKVTLRLLPLEDQLYEAPVGPFIYHVFDKNGRRVTTNDIFPDEQEFAAGTYQVQVVIQHHLADVLQRFSQIPLVVDQPLATPIPLRFWTSAAAAAARTGNFSPRLLTTEESVTFYVAEPEASALPKGLASGDRLLGKISYAADRDVKSDFTVEYSYSKPQASGNQTASATTETQLTLEKQIFEWKLKRLKTLDPQGEEFAQLLQELREAEPENREPLKIRLELLDTHSLRKERLPEIIAAADELIAQIDQTQLALSLIKRVPEGDAAAKKAREQAEQTKQELVDALFRKTRAISYRELPEVVEKTPIADQAVQDQEYQAAYQLLETWTDLSDEKYAFLQIRHASRQQRPAQAIQALNKFLKDDSTPRFFQRRRDLFKELGWEAWENWQQQEMTVKFPRELPHK